MGSDQHIQRSYGHTFGFQQYPYFPIASNQLIAVKGQYRQWQQKFIESKLICFFKVRCLYFLLLIGLTLCDIEIHL